MGLFLVPPASTSPILRETLLSSGTFTGTGSSTSPQLVYVITSGGGGSGGTGGSTGNAGAPTGGFTGSGGGGGGAGNVSFGQAALFSSSLS